MTVFGKHTCSEFIHIHTVNILYCRATLAFSLELAGIRIHCTPLDSAAEAESKIDSIPPYPYVAEAVDSGEKGSFFTCKRR